jgi:hypothetical protein
MKTSHKKNKKRGASILMLSFVFMALLFLIATAMYRLVPADMHAANRTHQDLSAHYVANAGLRATAAWLTDSMKRFEAGGGPQVLPDYAESGETVNLTAFEDEVNTAPSPFSDSNWTYEISIDVDPSTVGVSHNFQPRVFQIVSTAKFRGQPVRRVEAWIRQSTFASFAYFTDKFSGEMRIDGDLGFAGPVHTNEHFVFNVLNSNHYDDNLGIYFGDEVTHAEFAAVPDPGGDGNEWVGEKPYDASGPLAGRYEAIFEGGRNALRDKHEIALPSTSDDIKRVAWGGTSATRPYPTENGVYVNKGGTDVVDAGIFVKGDIREVFMGLDENGNQRMSYESHEQSGQMNANDPGGWNPAPIPPVTHQEPYDPPQYETDWVCMGTMIEVPPPPPSGGGGMGEPQGPTYECDEPLTAVQGDEIFQTIEDEPGVPGVWDPDMDNGESTDYDIYETIVLEAETATTFKHDNEIIYVPDSDPPEPIVLDEGETLMAKMQYDNEAPAGERWKLESYEVMNGLPNGTIYVDGHISGSSWGGDNGLHGVVKGSPQTSPDGTINTDDDGNVIYNSKVIATKLDKSISIGGDLLQFDPDAFGSLTPAEKELLDNHKDTRYLKTAALNPGHEAPATEPELSPTADHVLGIVTQDVWMRGRKDSHARNGNDGYNDVYAIMLAGRTHGGGEISGGFGTHHQQVNSNNGGGTGMGNFQIVGGVIQGTTGKNHGQGDWSKHYWINPAGTKGYQVSMHYDKIATYQRLFPTYAEFEVIRYLESSARDR